MRTGMRIMKNCDLDAQNGLMALIPFLRERLKIC